MKSEIDTQVDTQLEEFADLAAKMKKVAIDLPSGYEFGADLASRLISTDIPYAKSSIKEIRQALGPRFEYWSFSSHQGQDWDVISYLHKETGIRVAVYLKPDLNGATCRKVPSGETVELTKVVCTDG